jgi:hypothetical protein
VSEELKRCPFCGTDQDIEEHKPHDHSSALVAMGLPGKHPGSFTVSCPKCECGMIHATREGLIAAWNHRAAHPDHSGDGGEKAQQVAGELYTISNDMRYQNNRRAMFEAILAREYGDPVAEIFDRQDAGFERCYEALGITDDRERSWSSLVMAINDAQADPQDGDQRARKPIIDSPDILQRIKGAKERLSDGHALMRVPVDPTDPDCVLADAELEIERLRAALASSKAAAKESTVEFIDVVFAESVGTPNLTFVEVESPPGVGISFGEWVKRDDGYLVLRFNKAAAVAVGESYVKLFRPSTGDVFKALRTDSAGIADLLWEGWEISVTPSVTPTAPITSTEENKT